MVCSTCLTVCHAPMDDCHKNVTILAAMNQERLTKFKFDPLCSPETFEGGCPKEQTFWVTFNPGNPGDPGNPKNPGTRDSVSGHWSQSQHVFTANPGTYTAYTVVNSLNWVIGTLFRLQLSWHVCAGMVTIRF